ncbi:MAG: hypothetical protein P8L70_00580 [Halioglobus sp.]|nr:hypothetical protein [Halioglobus sp.]MDG2325199.1 hypothetical protein [Halioglobus sp.]
MLTIYQPEVGGSMAIKFAHDHPERVKGICLLGSTASWVQRDDFHTGLPERALDALARN